MLDFEDFKKKFSNINDEILNSSGLNWNDLEVIHSDYIGKKQNLENTAQMIANRLMKINNTHSVRYRIKDEDHLIEKIIRKCVENKDRKITLENYSVEITDLIGIRVLHLFKESWSSIYAEIKDTWEFKEKPIAYVRSGDTDVYGNNFGEDDFSVKEHPYGYRSLHFVIETQPSKAKNFIEIQVRTIFEEGWSEIDHFVRYPYDISNPLYSKFLLILNRLAGSSDEMGSFILEMKDVLEIKNSEISEKDSVIDGLRKKINESKLKFKEKQEINNDINEIVNYQSPYSRKFNNILEIQERLKRLHQFQNFNF